MRYVWLLIISVFCVVDIAISSPTNPQVAERPIPITAPRPPYPAIAMAKKISGTVLVDVQVNSDGKVIAVKSLMGPDILQKVAQQSAWAWRFKPFVLASGAFTVRLTFIFHDHSYAEPVKKPDFTSPYQIEIMYPEVQF